MVEVCIAAPTRSLSSYLARPDGAGPWPGVVVLHDVIGLKAETRRQADWLASSGYLALAPDLYSGGRGTFACVRTTFRDLFAGQGPTFGDIDAARLHLAERADCTGRIGVIGFCMGGGFALLAAAGHGFAASSVNYGAVPKSVDMLLVGACPVVGSFGARDRTLRGAAGRLGRALERLDVAHDVKEYPKVGHAFLNDHGGVLGWVTDRLGMAFDADAAADARGRILAFFHTHLR